MYREGTEWEGKIERLAWGGLGLATALDGRKILLSAPVALFPGEEVRARIHWKARHAEGEVTGWAQRDPRATRAQCPWARECGGCTLWEAGGCSGDLKRLMVEDLLARQLPDAPPFEWRPAPAEARRHRIQLHWDGRRLGSHARASHRIVEIEGCLAAATAISQAISPLRAALESGALPARPQRWELAAGTPAETCWAVDERGQAWRLRDGAWAKDDGPIRHDLEGIALAHSPGGFFQPCPPAAARAFRHFLEAWDLRGGTLYDLYGGVGLFSALLGARFARRVLVESAPQAVEWARTNLEALGQEAECLAEDVGEWLHEGLGEPGDLVLLDPPRTGLAPEVAERLRTSKASCLLLVGCDGAAFCRDVRRLAPEWRLERLAALDLFPLTPHVEFLGFFRPGHS